MSKNGLFLLNRNRILRNALSISLLKNIVGLTGLEPVTPALSRQCSNQLSYRPFALQSDKRHHRCKFYGGGMGIRTPDIQLAKLALYQLSYTPLLLKMGYLFQKK